MLEMADVGDESLEEYKPGQEQLAAWPRGHGAVRERKHGAAGELRLRKSRVKLFFLSFYFLLLVVYEDKRSGALCHEKGTPKRASDTRAFSSR